MFYVIDPDNRHLYGAQLEDMHRVRKSVFIDERGWDLKETAGLEIDQYDLPQTEYVLALAEGDRVHGGMRYLPLTGPNMTDDLFAGHLYKPLAPEGAIEATRGFVAKEARKTNLWGIGLCAKFEYLLWKGAERLIETIDITLLPVLLEVGWDIELTSRPFSDGKATYVCISTKVDGRALDLPRKKFGITSPVLYRVSEPGAASRCLAA
jgi:acyl homoserine lactone synthase